MPTRETAIGRTAEEEPALSFVVGFDRVNDDPGLLISVHSDTIQAMLLVAKHYSDEGIEVRIKGRVGEDEADRIQQDPIIKAFASSRANRKHELLVNGVCEVPPRLSVEDAADGTPYRCRFMDMREVVGQWWTGQTTANYLMLHFGGVTELEIGSDTATLSQLQEYAAALTWQVRARQLGEIPDPMLRDRLQRGQERPYIPRVIRQD